MVVVLAPDLLNVSIDSKSEFRQHTSTIKLLSPKILIKNLYPRFRTSILRQQSSRALWLLWCLDFYKIDAQICTSEHMR